MTKRGGDQLRDWMQRRGFNQAEAAEHFGWDCAFVSMLVNGKRTPGLTNAIIIERTTGIPVEAWSFSGRDDSWPACVGDDANPNNDKA